MSDMNVRLAIAPIGWTNDDLPELGGADKVRALGLPVSSLVAFEGL